MPGQQLWMNCAICNPGTEYMILMDAVWDLILPNPATAELVSVSTLIEQDIPREEAQLGRLRLGDPNLRNGRQIQPAPLNICNPQVRNFRDCRIRLQLTVLCDTANHFGNFAQPAPFPILGNAGQDSVLRPDGSGKRCCPRSRNVGHSPTHTRGKHDAITQEPQPLPG